MTDEQWAAFEIPIGLAFFMISSVTGSVIALYPSPAGATESELDLDAWAAAVRGQPGAASSSPTSEALIVNRLGDEPQQTDRADRRGLRAGRRRQVRAGRGSRAARGVERGGRGVPRGAAGAAGGRR